MTETNGLLLIDKSSGMTSHDVVARLRRLLNERRIGHAGTLDPMATGLLIVAVGSATRLLRFAQAEQKRYQGTVKLGVATDSLDADGAVVGEAAVPSLDAASIDLAARQLCGTQLQTPPMVSALKVGGRRLHELARAGVEVERTPREISVTHFTMTPTDDPTVVAFDVVCSVGTYVRVLLSDAARSLGTLGHLTSLRRTASGEHLVDDALTLDQVADALALGGAVVRPPAEFVRGLTAVELSYDDEARMRMGQRLHLGGETPRGEIAAFSPTGDLLGILRARDESWKPEIVLPPADDGDPGRLQS